MNKKHAFLLAFLITLLIAFNLQFISLFKTKREIVLVKRVIDGDTFQTAEGETIRLLNINTPEKNKQGYEEAREFLKQFQNKTIQVEKTEVDKYGRTLAKVFTPDYLNLEMVQIGLAKKFLVNPTESKIFSEAEEKAINQQKGIWKKSKYFNCFKTQINPKEETIFLKNKCLEINIKNWTIADESRKEYNFPEFILGQVSIHTFHGENNETNIFLNQKQNVWNNDKDSLYIFDTQGNLAHYDYYGY